MTPKTQDRTPYWQFRSMAERLAIMPCEGNEFGKDSPCADTGLCVTEWCAPCAALAWVNTTRELESQRHVEAQILVNSLAEQGSIRMHRNPYRY